MLTCRSSVKQVRLTSSICLLIPLNTSGSKKDVVNFSHDCIECENVWLFLYGSEIPSHQILKHDFRKSSLSAKECVWRRAHTRKSMYIVYVQYVCANSWLVVSVLTAAEYVHVPLRQCPPTSLLLLLKSVSHTQMFPPPLLKFG